MPLTIGSSLGPYEILAPAGEGGMGEVYKARDTRLDRTVAIKVLPSHLASEPDLKSRFEREARAISALQHPHICTLFDIGSQDGVDFLVMEFLEGETLSERIQQKGALPIAQVLKIGVEIADALERAHRSGILHRDLKPGNIMLTKAGAKLMDFGLAKTSPLSGASGAATLTAAITRSSPASPVTQAGTIVGTFQYMSPEQLEGKDADARTDIFGFGAVLYEMATGKRAFEGKSQISVMSAILEKEPEPISNFQPLTPPAFEHVVNRALAKDPDERWQTVADLRSEMKWISQTSSSVRAASPGIKRKRYAKWMMLAGVAAAAAIVTALTMWLLGAGREPALVQTFLLPPEGGEFKLTGPNAGPPAISPDGQKVVFQSRGSDGSRLLWLRTLDALAPKPITGTESGSYPFWSPDSKQIGFFQDGKMKRVDIIGGPVTTICEASAGRGGTWNKDGVILFTPSTGDPIHRVSSSGGTSTPVTKVEVNETSHRWPWFLPDGKHFLYLGWNASGDESGESFTIYAASVEGGMREQVVKAASNVAYANGHLIYVRGGNLLAQKFDPDSRKVEGDPFPLFERIQTDPQFGRSNFSVSQTGAVVFTIGPSAAEARLLWFSQEGKELGQVAAGGNWSSPRISPDGKMLAVAQDQGNQDVWLLSLTRELRSRLTFDPAPENNPVWSPDSKRIAFVRQKSGANRIVVKAVDGSGEEEVLLELPDALQISDWSRDGKYISLNVTTPGLRTDLWVLPTFGDKKAFRVLGTPFNDADPMFSPDGKWILYDSNASGTAEIYAMPFPGPGGKFQISSGGGDWPRWTADGKHVIYSNAVDYFIADVSYTHDSLHVTGTRKLFTVNAVGSAANYSYDVGRDGRMLVVASPTKVAMERLAWISDWRKQIPK